MRLKVDGGHDKYSLRLGVQTNKGFVHVIARWKASRWAPRRAQRFSYDLVHTDYRGTPADEETGYAIITVRYYSLRDEGDHPVRRGAPYPDTRPAPS